MFKTINYNLFAYMVYLPILLYVMVFLGRLLFRKGRLFLLEIFNGEDEEVDRINRMLLLGYYLINLGYAVYSLALWDHLESWMTMLNALSVKLGIIILALGLLHYNNILWLVLYSKYKSNKIKHHGKL